MSSSLVHGAGLVDTSKVTAAYDGIGRLPPGTYNKGKASDETSKVTSAYAWDDSAETTVTQVILNLHELAQRAV